MVVDQLFERSRTHDGYRVGVGCRRDERFDQVEGLDPARLHGVLYVVVSPMGSLRAG